MHHPEFIVYWHWSQSSLNILCLWTNIVCLSSILKRNTYYIFQRAFVQDVKLQLKVKINQLWLCNMTTVDQLQYTILWILYFVKGYNFYSLYQNCPELWSMLPVNQSVSESQSSCLLSVGKRTLRPMTLHHQS